MLPDCSVVRYNGICVPRCDLYGTTRREQGLLRAALLFSGRRGAARATLYKLVLQPAD